ncbi:AraC family transcriptional regulator [Microbacterium sp. APC 3901]|uniref:helix-turn-helix transcriptional regulator n=1 Tax=Microbacterium sp. APC 3901 TaxID=3035192 RepID=UPI0025B2CD12|nr:AraC family transcriptional regulator [Microbacterium sp. APC 3901]MDN3443907.1 AraC family transcriptional regulator [Microbacterium sp. APC 3901]
MSLIGQHLDESVVWRIDTRSFELADHVEWDAHSHDDQHELLWGTRGALTAETDDGYFAIPGSLGLWIPAGVTHRVVAAAGTAFRCTFIDVDIPPIATRTTAVAIPEVVRAVLDRLGASPHLSASPRIHAEELALSLLEPVEVSTIDLPLPRDTRTRLVAGALLADPSDDRSLEDWGHHVGASARNLSRLFVSETGMSFSTWRTRARMRRAIEWLAADYTVAHVSRRAGYATPSAFVQAFRRELGRTPGEFATVRSDATKKSA